MAFLFCIRCEFNEQLEYISSITYSEITFWSQLIFFFHMGFENP